MLARYAIQACARAVRACLLLAAAASARGLVRQVETACETICSKAAFLLGLLSSPAICSMDEVRGLALLFLIAHLVICDLLALLKHDIGSKATRVLCTWHTAVLVQHEQ